VQGMSQLWSGRCETTQTKKLRAINNSQIYLQVLMMADIADIEGVKFLKEVFYGTEDPITNQNTKKYSRSL
jgi:adenine C2-methylase RlmN of 23S rRNA A2503 and tRNA A37